eukprot:363664-Chlamydomonas_euryale.AAC.9
MEPHGLVVAHACIGPCCKPGLRQHNAIVENVSMTVHANNVAVAQPCGCRTFPLLEELLCREPLGHAGTVLQHLLIAPMANDFQEKLEVSASEVGVLGGIERRRRRLPAHVLALEAEPPNVRSRTWVVRDRNERLSRCVYPGIRLLVNRLSATTTGPFGHPAGAGLAVSRTGLRTVDVARRTRAAAAVLTTCWLNSITSAADAAKSD